MNKKGFTLVELLAVIIILSLLALLASTSVSKIVKDSKGDLYDTQVKLIQSAAEAWGADNLYDLPDAGTCKTLTLKDLKSYGLIDPEIKDPRTNKLFSNSLLIKISGEENKYGLNNISYEVDSNDVATCRAVYPVCTLVENGDVAPEGISVGDKYQCKVKDNMEEEFEDGYYFYVLSQEEDGTTNLIMDRNINSDGTPTTKAILESEKNTNGGIYNLVAWVSKSDAGTFVDFDEDGCEYESGCVLNDKGPLTAMNFLQEATKNWTNTNEMLIEKFEECDTEDNCTTKDMKAYNTYSRMPYYNEVKDVSTDKMWLIDYLTGENDEAAGIEGRENAITGISGYWTLTASSDISYKVWHVDYNGSMMDDFSPAWDDVSGVRPVINVRL